MSRELPIKQPFENCTELAEVEMKKRGDSEHCSRHRQGLQPDYVQVCCTMVRLTLRFAYIIHFDSWRSVTGVLRYSAFAALDLNRSRL